MFLVATLCPTRAIALKMLREIPDNSMIQFPETVQMTSKQIIKYSRAKNLFIIYQSDIKEGDKTYVTFRGVDKGNEIWQVRKFNLWHTDKGYYSPSKPEPIINIRGHKAGLFICLDAVEIFKMAPMLIQEKVELLCIVSNWQFNYQLIDRIADFSLKQIPTLKAVLFSNTNTLSFIKTRTQEKRITETGYVELTI